jgi:hypothetical protein
MMNWLRRALRDFLLIDNDYTLNLVRKEIIAMIKAFQEGNPYYSYSNHGMFISNLQTMVYAQINAMADNEIRKIVKTAVEELDINKEKFLDETVARLQAKQLKVL